MLCQMPKIYILHNLFSKILGAQHEKILLVGMNQTSRLGLRDGCLDFLDVW